MNFEDTVRSLIREELFELKRDLLAEIRRTLPVTSATHEYLTTDEAADLARVTPATIREWVKAGALTELRAGQKILIKTSEIHAFLAGDLLPNEDEVVARELARIGVR